MAWATMALPACCRICARLRLAVSVAKSASMMRLRAADWFSTACCRLEMIASKRLCVAPKVARVSLTLSIALSMLSITVPTAVEFAALPMLALIALFLFLALLLFDRPTYPPTGSPHDRAVRVLVSVMLICVTVI